MNRYLLQLTVAETQNKNQLFIQGMMGSFGNIYDSIGNLSTTYLQPNVNKETLLKYKIHISLATHCSWNSKQKLIVYSR